MPRLDGVEAARLLMERHPEMGIVLVSGTERMDVEFIPKDEVDRKLVGALMQAGAGSRRLRVIRL
jgi:hypothetical protein